MASRCKGFRFASTACGIKASGALDLGLIVSDTPAASAAVFTKNRMAAAPVKVSRAHLRSSGGRMRAAIVNSGNANACTGPQGAADARAMAAHTARALDADRRAVVVSSTGVIGQPLPMDRIEAGITTLAARPKVGGFDGFAHAILTTDKRAKIASTTVRIGSQRITLLGCTKGAGMIAPNMATTLSFVVSDANIAPATLSSLLAPAVDATYNAISVDGDTSTNDMVLVMAGGAVGGKALRGPGARAFGEALQALLGELASALMADGEGVNHVVTVRVRGAASAAAARKVARTIANSPLVKTAIAGADPNWGRILCAAGNAGVPLSPDRVALHLGDVPVVAGGVAVADAEAAAAAVMRAPRYEMVLDLGSGKGAAHYLACDLSHEYVTINADYRT